MLTLSGRLILPGGDNSPSLEDLVVSLGRIPRFGGQTRRWWPVLLHLMVCDRILRRGLEESGPAVTPAFAARARLLALFHDAHEAVTGDVPTPWKTDETRKQQTQLDHRIHGHLLPEVLPLKHLDTPQLTREVIAAVDHRALLAEGLVVGPPGFADLFYPENVDPGDAEIVRLVALLYPTPGHTDGPDAPAVKDFIELVNTLLFLFRSGT